MIDEHHDSLAPSSLPMLEQCPCFERADDAISLEPKEREMNYRDHGTMMHYAFERRMTGKNTILEGGLTPHELEGIEWAVDYTKARLTTEYPVQLEHRMLLLDEAFRVVTFGTGDVVNGRQLFDLKTGDLHNYWLQMAAYALMQMDLLGVDEVDIYLLFTRLRRAIELKIKREEASRRVFAVIRAVQDPDKKPRANPYCKWCRKVMTCEAVIHLVSGTEHERYQIDEPDELSEALFRAKIVKEWATRIEAHAKALAMSGTEIPHFYLKPRQGAREIMDVKRAYELSGLSADEFIVLCNLPVGAVEDAIAIKQGITKSAAKKLVNTQLSEVIARRQPTIQLALTNPEKEEPIEI